jgi:hypothetical protein
VSYTASCGGNEITYPATQVFYTANAATTPVRDRFAVYWSTPDYKTGVCPTCDVGITITMTIKK